MHNWLNILGALSVALFTILLRNNTDNFTNKIDYCESMNTLISKINCSHDIVLDSIKIISSNEEHVEKLKKYSFLLNTFSNYEFFTNLDNNKIGEKISNRKFAVKYWKYLKNELLPHINCVFQGSNPSIDNFPIFNH